MGSVYHADLCAPHGFRRTCAVKVMNPVEGDNAHLVERMRDEARLLGLLQDEHILGVSELVRVAGRDAVVMEYVEGADLQELRTVARMPPRALAELGAELAGTLHRAHTAKHPNTGEPLSVVHRDVKPANVMVTSRGGVRLLDFGVARAVFGGREAQTRGLVLGTFNYFPPEVIIGADPSPAVDLYGLGVSLWECASGDSWGTPVIQQSRFERRVERRVDGLDPGYAPLADVLKSLLAFEPADRPNGARAEQLFLAIADSLEGEGLRSWARRVVPDALARRVPPELERSLVGQTIEVGQRGASEPASTDQVEEAFEDNAFDDVVMTRWELNPEVQAQVNAAAEKRAKAKKQTSSSTSTSSKVKPAKKRKGAPLWLIMLLGALAGLVVGVFALALLIVVAVALS